jgi:putative ABC transport system permease protein
MAGMRLSDILRLYRARLRARTMLAQEGFAIVGIAVGVALLFASQVAGASLARSVTQLDRQIVGDTQLQLIARGPGGFDERLLAQARRVPGVSMAFPIVEQQADVIGARGRRAVDLIGADPRFTHLGGALLQRFTVQQLAAQQTVVLPLGLAQTIGARSLQTIKLQVGVSVTETLLGATLGQADIGGLAHSQVAIAPIAYAQSLAGMHGRISRIFIRTVPGRESAARTGLARLAAVAGVSLERSDYDARLFSLAVAPQSQSEGLFSAISALVGFMLALNAMLITVPARRRLIESIIPQGAARSMIVRILLLDAAVLGVLACVIGLALGELLSLVAFRATPGYLAFAFPVGNERVVSWSSFVLAAGAGLAAAGAGVLWPLRDLLSRHRARAEAGAVLGAPRRQRRRAAARLAVGLTGIAVALVTVTLFADSLATILGNLALIVALVCLLPFCMGGLTTLYERAQRHRNGAASALAVITLRAPQTQVRALAIATTAAVAVFGAVTFQGTQANLLSGLDASAGGIDANADVWVMPRSEANAFATIPFTESPARTRVLARLPGVAAVGVYRGSFLDWGPRRLWVLAPPADAGRSVFASELSDGDPRLADARVRHGGWAVLSHAVAAEHHLRVGQAFVLASPRPLRLRVAALITNLGWPPGTIVLNAADYARAWGSSDPSAYEIQVKPGARATTVRRLVRRTLGSEAAFAVETAREREHLHDTLAAQGLARLTEIRLLMLLAAVLAIAGAMGSMLWQRRGLVAFMKVDGYRRGVLWRWLACESAVLLTAGCAIGAIFGLYAQLLGSHYLASVTGFPIALGIEPLAALSGFALVTLVAAAVTSLPGYLVVRVPAGTVGAGER